MLKHIDLHSCLLLYIALLAVQMPTAAGEYPHRDFDWEGDDLNEDDPPGEFESCFACHDGGMFSIPESPRKRCEDCHITEGTAAKPEGPYSYYNLGYDNQNYSLRPDYEGMATLVYSHLRFPNKTMVYSSCLSYDPSSGEGVCHGVSFVQGRKAGGYFAFNSTVEFPLDAPYARALPSMNYPRSMDCLFCHGQQNREIRIAWGNPSQVRMAGLFRHFNATSSADCLGCHYTGNIANFHSAGLRVERVGIARRYAGLMATLAVLLIIVGYLVIRLRRSMLRK